jgi:hypothetical protein
LDYFFVEPQAWTRFSQHLSHSEAATYIVGLLQSFQHAGLSGAEEEFHDPFIQFASHASPVFRRSQPSFRLRDEARGKESGRDWARADVHGTTS